ncbi:MAG: hypothetical protein COA59_11105 [Colwellia sp.]|nr:MAG: hypothetical protein COA59_11105 [Colwellia sp.]
MRIKELDALRGLAALAVVFYHYTTQYDKLFGHTVGLNWQLPYGSFGVQLFFMISGFVIFLTLDRITKPMDFVVSRASRLYPPYWSAIIMTTAIVWTFGLHGEERNLFTTLTNFTMIQGVFEIPDVDGVYWTLLYELIFYCIIFTFFKWGNFKKIHWLIIIGLLINILNSTVDWIPWKIQLFLLLQYNHLFSAGIIFYLIKKEEINKQYALSLLLCLIAHWMQGELISSILVTLFFVVFTLFVYGKLSFIAIKPLTWLGSISYSLYLLHQNIGYIIIREIEAKGFSPNIAIFSALVASLLLAHIIMKTIERPCQIWIKNRYKASTP